MKSEIAKTEAIGAAFMILSGSALHFLFEWSSNWQPLALIAAVNEVGRKVDGEIARMTQGMAPGLNLPGLG